MRAAQDPDLFYLSTRDLSCLTAEEFVTLWYWLGVLARKSAIAARAEARGAEARAEAEVERVREAARA